MRRVASDASSSGLLLLNAMNLPHAFGAVTSYLGAAPCASAGSGRRNESGVPSGSHGRAAMMARATAATVRTAFV
jgi:hypothetical protein